MPLGPGSRLILKNGLPLLSIPLLTFYAAKRLSLPLYLRVLVAVGVLPFWLFAKITARDVKERIAAARIGAQIIPRVRGKKPGNLDIVKSLVQLANEGYPGDGLEEILRVYGNTVDFWPVWEHLMCTTDPYHIKQILATEFNNFEKGARFQEAMSSVLGTGVFNSDNDMWKFHRAMTRPFFTKERISHFELFDRHATEIIAKMKERLREGYTVNFQDAMYRFTLDSATEFLFGMSVDSIASVLPYPHHADAAYHQRSANRPHATTADEFAEAFKRAQEIIADRERTGWIWPFSEMYEDSSTKHMKIVNSFVEPIIKNAIEKKARGEEKDEEGESLLENLVRETTDPVVLRDETINIMIAGRDTTAGTLTFIFYFLSMYPAVMTRLREEILQQVGPTRMPTYDDVKEMKYLRAVINETLRLYPSVPFNIRTSVKATTMPSSDPERPYYIPPRTRFMYSVFHMHRRTDLWGPDAEEFDPDRFLSTDPRLKKYLLKNSFIFLPFNAGPRICLGQQFAYNEMSFMIIRLLQNFSAMELDLTSHPPSGLPPAEWAVDEMNRGKRKGMDKVFPKSHLTMYSKGGLWLKMKETDAKLEA